MKTKSEKTSEEDPLRYLSPFMTPQEVAELLRISVPSVYKYLNDGVIPGFQMGATWRCRRDQIMALGLPSKN